MGDQAVAALETRTELPSVFVRAVARLEGDRFFESQGQGEEYLNLDFHLGPRFGVGGGGTVRLGPVDVSVAYQHTFFGELSNGGKGDLLAISGDMSTANRSRQAVNGGSLRSSLNEVGLAGTFHF